MRLTCVHTCSWWLPVYCPVGRWAFDGGSWPQVRDPPHCIPSETVDMVSTNKVRHESQSSQAIEHLSEKWSSVLCVLHMWFYYACQIFWRSEKKIPSSWWLRNISQNVQIKCFKNIDFTFSKYIFIFTDSTVDYLRVY